MHSVVSDSLWPHGLQPTKLLLPGFSKKWQRNQKHLISIDKHRPTGIIIAKWKEQEGLRPFNNLCFLNNSYCLTSVVPIPLVLLPLWPPSFCAVDDVSSIYPINVGFFFPHCFVRFSFNSHSICYTLKRLLIAIAARDVSQK